MIIWIDSFLWFKICGWIWEYWFMFLLD